MSIREGRYDETEPSGQAVRATRRPGPTGSQAAAALRAILPGRLALVLQYVGSTGSLVAANAAQLVTFAILARSLGVQQFGVLVTVTAVTSLAVQLCGLGATETMVRRVASEPALYRQALGHNLILTAGSGLVLVAALSLALPFFFTLSPDPAWNALTLFVLVFVNVVLVRGIVLAEQIFIAHWRFSQANLVLLGFAVIRTLAAMLACLVFGVESVEAWAFWHAGAHLAMAAICLAALRPLGAPRWVVLRDEVKLGFYFCTPFFFQALRQNVDLIALGAAASPEIVGSYAMARKIADASFLTVNAMHRLTYPRFAAATARGIRSAFPLALRIFALGGLIALATALAVFLVAPLMALAFGTGFSAMADDLRVLCWLVLFVMSHDVAASFLGASGRHGLRAAIYNGVCLAGSALLALLTTLYLVPGTLIALYAVEATLAVAFWIALLVVVRRDGHRAIHESRPA